MWLFGILTLSILVLAPALKQKAKQDAVNKALDLGLDDP